MIQLLYLVKTTVMLITIGTTWLGSLWYMRTRNIAARLSVIFTSLYLVRSLVHISVYALYYSGYRYFVTSLAVLETLDTLLFLGIAFYWIFLLEHISSQQNVALPSWLKYVVLAVGFSVYTVLLLLRYFSSIDIHSIVTGYRVLRYFGGGLAIVSLGVLWLNRKYRNKQTGIERSLWLTLFLLSACLPLASIYDDLFPSFLKISTGRDYFLPRWTSSMAAAISFLPLIYRYSNLLTHYRSADNFIDVERAIESIKRDVGLTLSQEEVFRYYLERGWGESLQFYGWYVVRQETKPVLKALGIHNLSELLHRIHIEQKEDVIA